MEWVWLTVVFSGSTTALCSGVIYFILRYGPARKERKRQLTPAERSELYQDMAWWDAEYKRLCDANWPPPPPPVLSTTNYRSIFSYVGRPKNAYPVYYPWDGGAPIVHSHWNRVPNNTCVACIKAMADRTHLPDNFVLLLQKNLGVVPDGILGPQTTAALQHHVSRTTVNHEAYRRSLEEPTQADRDLIRDAIRKLDLEKRNNDIRSK